MAQASRAADRSRRRRLLRLQLLDDFREQPRHVGQDVQRGRIRGFVRQLYQHMSVSRKEIVYGL